MKKMVYVGAFAVTMAIAANSFALVDDDQFEESEALSKTRITLSQAIDNALTAIPGKALSAELDNRDEEIFFVVEVVKDHETYEICLDSQTGEVVYTRLDKKDDDKDEGEDRG